jgi:CRISPR-associated protein Cas6
MVWMEATNTDPFTVPNDVVDLSFRFECRELPVDNGLALQQAVTAALPWMQVDDYCAVHPIYGAASGNGWSRPAEHNGMLQISRRTRLYLRIPKDRIADASELQGRSLEIMGHYLDIGSCEMKPLVASSTIFSRSVCHLGAIDETVFSEWIVETLADRHIKVRKLLCGLPHQIQTLDKAVTGRSVLLADLELTDSISLQQKGIGEFISMGCGLFLPHKSLASVKPQD